MYNIPKELEFFLIVLLGLVFGSFISLISYRLPRDEQIITRSACPKCKHLLGIFDLFPLFSWLAHKGQCKYCHEKISIRYPIIEMLSTIIMLIIYNSFGLSTGFAIYSLISLTLLTVIIIDLEHYIIPDSLQILLLISAIIFNFHFKVDWMDRIFASLLSVAAMLVIRKIVYMWKKRDPLGIGDVKFVAIAAILLGTYTIPVFLFIAGLLGIFTSIIWKALKKGDIFPFAPALAISLLICITYRVDQNLFSDFALYFMPTGVYK